jgi:cell division protein FtsZ
MLSDDTKIVFITAGMEWLLVQGLQPVIARVQVNGNINGRNCHHPFIFEGKRKIIQALKGVEAISKNVDALLVISNERLRQIYADMTITNAFGKADDTLTIAAEKYRRDHYLFQD